MLVRGGQFAAGAAACGGFGAQAFAQAKTLRVTHFGGPYQALDTIAAKPFEAAKGTRVVYDVEISPTLLPKLQADRSNPPFDVVMLSRAFALRASKAGLLAKVEPSELPESAHLIKDALAPGGWGAAMMLDTMDIMVDTKQVSTPLTSWLDLWRPDLKGKILLPSAVEGSICFSFLASLIRALGGDVKSDAAVNEAFKRLQTLKPNLRGFFSDATQANMMIERGEIAVAPQYAIRIANSTRRSPHVVKASPKEGMVAVPYDLCVPLNVKDPGAAKAYIDFTLTKPVQTALATSLMATPVRTDVALPPEVAPLINVDPNLIWFLDPEFAASKERQWLDRYTREVQS
jgi:spermidine/putrescine-binding protein